VQVTSLIAISTLLLNYQFAVGGLPELQDKVGFSI